MVNNMSVFDLKAKREASEKVNCTNTDDSYICACKEGYTGDGHSCQDIIITFDPANIRIKFLKNNNKKTLSIKT